MVEYKQLLFVYDKPMIYYPELGGLAFICWVEIEGLSL